MTTTTPRMTRAEQKALTRRRLLDAAGRVVDRMGWAATTTELVVAEAGVTRGALYANFTDRDDLLLTLLAEQLSSVNANRSWPTEPDLGDFVASLEATVTDLDRVQLSAQVLTGGEVLAWALRDERARTIVAGHYRTALAALADHLEAASPPGELRAADRALLLGALTTGFAQLRVLLGPGTATAEVLHLGAELLAGAAREPRER